MYETHLFGGQVEVYAGRGVLRHVLHRRALCRAGVGVAGGGLIRSSEAGALKARPEFFLKKGNFFVYFLYPRFYYFMMPQVIFLKKKTVVVVPVWDEKQYFLGHASL